MPTVIPSETGSRADMARSRLIRAGVQCSADRGLDGVTIRELARIAGQNSASIAYYFGGKDGLYAAVIDTVMHFFSQHLAMARKSYLKAVEGANLSREQAVTLLKQFQRSFAMGVLTDEQAAQFAILMVREQNQPTAAFETLYTDTVAPLHRISAHLVSVITGEDQLSARVILRTHTLIGQLMSFFMARETLLRRMGWTGYDADRARLIADLLDENLDILMAGLTAASPATEEPS